MTQKAPMETKYYSFEEFKRAFYPQATKADESQQSQESYGREMARYIIGRHFPTRDEKAPCK
jgi:hypothetical protein